MNSTVVDSAPDIPRQQSQHESSDAYRHAQQWLTMAQDAGRCGAWVWDVASGQITWSEECCALFERAPANYELWLKLIHPDDRERVERELSQCLRERREIDLEFRVRVGGDAVRWINARGRTTYSGPDQAEHVVGIAFDITERKQAEVYFQRSNRRLELLSEVSSRLLASIEPQAIINELCQKVMAFLDCHVFVNFLLDEQKRRLYLNTCGGISPDQAKSIESLDLGVAVCGCVARDGCRIIAEEIPTTPDVRTELVRSFGVKAYACHPLLSQGRVIGTLSFGTRSRTRFEEHELSLMKAVADHIAIAMERMRYQEMLQRNQKDLRTALAQADAASRAKDVFLAVLSHELRTPLNPVLMVASSLQADARLPAPVREDLATIRQNVELEARLIDDLLDLTQLSRGRMRLQAELVDAHQELRSAIGMCEADMLAKGLAPEVHLTADSHHLMADRARLRQVFWNVIKNAVKFTANGGRISIKTWNEAAEPDQRLIVEVTDTGVGIAPQDLTRIFSAFDHGDAATGRRFGGLGLGLAISKALVELHGGRISAHSNGRGMGASFRIELNGVRPASGQVTADAPEAAAGRGLRILLVEDHAITATVLTRLLRSMSHDVKAAGCVREAIQLAGADRFDLLISDVGLPDGTGLELMKQLKAQYGLRGIAMSGYGMEQDIQDSRQAGFEMHLTKPVSIQQLEAALERISGE